MIDLFLKGGPLMYPLLLCSVVSVAVIVERGLLYLRAGTSRAAVSEVLASARDGRPEEALDQSRDLGGAVGLVLAEALENRNLPREDLENHLSLTGSAEIKGLSRHLHYLELIGKIAPMLGLSGTVLGLARTFQTVASATRFADPSLLASGIWEALITTVAGLFIGIPALIFYHLYDNRVRSLAFEMRTGGEEMVAILEEARRGQR